MTDNVKEATHVSPGHFDQGNSAKPEIQKLVVQVRYTAAPQPFVDSQADPSESLASLLQRVKAAFEVSDGTNPDGGSVQYFLYQDDVRLENLSVPLSSLILNEHVLKLKLVQIVHQG